MDVDTILDSIWKAMPTNSKWGYHLYPPFEGKGSELYFTDPDGNCWQVTVAPHPHMTEPEPDYYDDKYGPIYDGNSNNPL